VGWPSAFTEPLRIVVHYVFVQDCRLNLTRLQVQKTVRYILDLFFDLTSLRTLSIAIDLSSFDASHICFPRLGLRAIMAGRVV